MAPDFWRQALDPEPVIVARTSTGVRAILPSSPRVLETFWTRCRMSGLWLPLPHRERRHLTLLPRDQQSSLVAQELYERLRRSHTLLHLEPVDSGQTRFVDHLSTEDLLEPLHQEDERHRVHGEGVKREH